MPTNLPNILIVDDNIQNLKVTTNILKNQGYLIGLAQSGTTALNQIEAQVPDLILLDIMMPEMDGIEVCRKIKQQEKWADIPIIFLTAKSQTEDLVEAFEAGGVDYVTKPFRKDELLARVKTHIDLYRSKLEISEMIKTRDKLYSIIAHDVKTPFSSILLIIDALKNDIVKCGSEEYKKLISQLETGTNNTLTLLNNLLTWTRYQSGIVEITPVKTDLNRLLLESAQLLQPIAKDKNITLNLNIPEECIAFFDETTIQTVIRNLITNAIKFTPENGIVKLILETNGKYKKIIVEDNGIGMSEEAIQKIFTENKSFTTKGTKLESGTGLGLMMIKDFVKLNNGELNVKSQLNVGTQFTVFLPSESKLN